VGLDISAAELSQAPPGSYDETVVGDLEVPEDHLRRRFDLVVSWLLFEHLRDVRAGLETVRGYLRDGGAALLFMAGRNSLPALLNRLLPQRGTKWLLRQVHGRPPESVFKAYYDRCTYGTLLELAPAWRSFEVEPFFWAGDYVMSSRPLLAAVLAYEEWIVRTGCLDRASYYLVCARV
jgi:SAM-dependent methyltransferase